MIEFIFPVSKQKLFCDKTCPEHGVKELEVKPMSPIWRRVWVDYEKALFIKRTYDEAKHIQTSEDGRTALIEYLDYELLPA